jgi:hypothetical protein
MFSEEKNKKSIEKFAEKIYNNFENKNYKIVAEAINNPFLLYLSFEATMNSRFSRSFTSSFGTCFQHAVVDIAKNQGFSIINDGNNDDNIELKGYYSDKTRQVVDQAMDYINKSSAKSPITEAHIKSYFQLIKESVFDSSGDEKTVNADLVLFRNNKITCIELKAGGDLDKGKAHIQRRETFEIYAILVSKYREEVFNHKIKIEMKFGTFYNKNDMISGVENWKQPSVKKNFLESELLIGTDFWAFVCNDKNAYSKILKIYNECREKIKKCITVFNQKSVKEILKKAETIKNKEIKNTIKLSLEEEFLFGKEQLDFIFEEGFFNYILLTEGNISFINKENKMKNLKIIEEYNYEQIFDYLTTTSKLENISSNYFKIK